jgi:hypothetical protein
MWRPQLARGRSSPCDNDDHHDGYVVDDNDRVGPRDDHDGDGLSAGDVTSVDGPFNHADLHHATRGRRANYRRLSAVPG